MRREVLWLRLIYINIYTLFFCSFFSLKRSAIFGLFLRSGYRRFCVSSLHSRYTHARPKTRIYTAHTCAWRMITWLLFIGQSFYYKYLFNLFLFLIPPARLRVAAAFGIRSRIVSGSCCTAATEFDCTCVMLLLLAPFLLTPVRERPSIHPHRPPDDGPTLTDTSLKVDSGSKPFGVTS